MRRVLAAVAGCVLISLGTRAEPVPVWPEGLAAERKALLEQALDFLKAHPSVPYTTGGSDARGMDCSGAMVFLLKLSGVEPPRSAHGQYEWLRQLGRLTDVPAAARTPEDPVFAGLRPGDLIFWVHDGPGAPSEIHVSHVHMYLGTEKDGHAIMIGSSDGRAYRGAKVDGFGITDFRVPKDGSPTRIVAFGPPPPLPPPPAAASGATVPTILRHQRHPTHNLILSCFTTPLFSSSSRSSPAFSALAHSKAPRL